MNTKMFQEQVGNITPICRVVNDDKNGWTEVLVETLPGVTLNVGTKLYKESDVLKLFDALAKALLQVDRLEERDLRAFVNEPGPVKASAVPVVTPKVRSSLPKGVMAALLAGWTAHNPTIHWEKSRENAKPWVALWAPHDGPNADWNGHQLNFDLEPVFIQWLGWAAEGKRFEIRQAIQNALGI